MLLKAIVRNFRSSFCIPGASVSGNAELRNKWRRIRGIRKYLLSNLLHLAHQTTINNNTI
jgi:hypothetical protein